MALFGAGTLGAVDALGKISGGGGGGGAGDIVEDVFLEVLRHHPRGEQIGMSKVVMCNLSRTNAVVLRTRHSLITYPLIETINAPSLMTML